MNLQKTETEMVIVESGKSTLAGAAICILLGLIVIAITIFDRLVGSKGTNPTPAWLPILGLLFVGLGGFLVFSAERHETRLSKSGPCSFNKKKIIGGNTNATQFNLADINEVEHIMNINTSSSDGRTSYTVEGSVILSLKNGEKLEVGKKSEKPSGWSASIGNMAIGSQNLPAPLETEANEISRFCGAQLVTKDYRNPTNVIGAIKEAVLDAQQKQEKSPNPEVPTNNLPSSIT